MLCVWIRNDLQSPAPRQGTSTAAAWANRLHHSLREDPRQLRGSTDRALGEHHSTGTWSSIRSLLATRLCHGTSQPPGKLLGCCRLCRWHWFSPFSPFPPVVMVVLPTAPHRSLRAYLIFVRAGHSLCLNQTEAPSVTANGS